MSNATWTVVAVVGRPGSPDSCGASRFPNAVSGGSRLTELTDAPAKIGVLTDERAVIVEVTVGDFVMGVTYENRAAVETLIQMLECAATEVFDKPAPEAKA